MSSRADEITKLFSAQPGDAPGAPVGVHEMPFRDTDGVMKIWRDGTVVPYRSAGNDSQQSVNNQPSVADLERQEDERDLARVQVPVGQRPMVSQHADAVIAESGIVASKEATLRLHNVLISRLRGIRSQVELKEILLSVVERGGIGLDAATANRVLQAATRHDEELHHRLRSAVSMDQPEHVSLLTGPAESDSASQKLLPPAGDQPTVTVSGVTSQNKPVMADVKFRPTLTGPVEELAALTIVDFRRLAATPAAAIERIFEKVELLEQEAFDKKIAGIQAWRRSEVYRTYVAIGRESMERQQPIAAIIAERLNQRQITLTIAEFEALANLSEKLRKYHF